MKKISKIKNKSKQGIVHLKQLISELVLIANSSTTPRRISGQIYSALTNPELVEFLKKK